jgi:hypothetical protein
MAEAGAGARAAEARVGERGGDRRGGGGEGGVGGRAARWLRVASAALLGLQAAVLVAAEWQYAFLAETGQQRLDPSEVNATLAEWQRDSVKFPELDPVDDADIAIDVLYAEYVIASWELPAGWWNAYHSGVVFQRRRRSGGQILSQFTVDFKPVKTDEVSYSFLPLVDAIYPDWMPRALGVLYARLRGAQAYDLRWQNAAGVVFTLEVPPKYQNFTAVGEIGAAQFNAIIKWARDYGSTNRAFTPYELWFSHSGNVALESRFCHDLSTNLLRELVKMGMKQRCVGVCVLSEGARLQPSAVHR